MTKHIAILFIAFLTALAGCKKNSTEDKTAATSNEKQPATKTKPSDTKTPPKTPDKKPPPPKVPPLAPGNMPFEFPILEKTDAMSGDKVFSVNMKLVMNAYNAGKKQFGTQYLLATMKTPGSKQSIVTFVSDQPTPNSGIVRIPKGITAKKGDIVAGKWAVNMTRGIVTDASNPKAPKVRFIGLSYDNPAKADDKKTGIGVYDYQLKEGEFLVISKPYDPASACALKKGSSYKLMTVFRAHGDRVMGTQFTRFTSAAKADCLPLPLRPKYKKGTAVWAPWVGTMSKGKITKVDVGRYLIKFDESQKGEKMIAFGEVIDKLPK